MQIEQAIVQFYCFAVAITVSCVSVVPMHLSIDSSRVRMMPHVAIRNVYHIYILKVGIFITFEQGMTVQKFLLTKLCSLRAQEILIDGPAGTKFNSSNCNSILNDHRTKN